MLDDQNAGLILRQHREQLTGRWQGPVGVAAGSVLLCLGLGSRADMIAAELLVRALREQRLDARHVSIEELETVAPPPEAHPGAVALGFLVSAFPEAEREQAEQTVARLRKRLADARVVCVFLPGVSLQGMLGPEVAGADCTVSSFVQAVEVCIARERPETP